MESRREVHDHFRAHARKRANLRATVAHLSGAWERSAALVDIGLAGACLVFDGVVEPGDAVTVAVVAPTLWDPLVVASGVVWVRPEGPTLSRVGVAFRQSDPNGAVALLELLATLVFDP